MFPVAKLTVYESLGKKTLLAVLIAATLFLLLILFFLSLDYVEGAKTYIKFMGIKEAVSKGVNPTINAENSLTEIVIMIESGMAAVLYAITIFLSLFATNDFIPSMIKKGYVDLILSKPMSRYRVLNERIFGAVFIVAAIVAYITISAWLIISFKSGVWHYEFLFSAFMIILVFFILFMEIVFFGLLTGSGMFAVILTVGMMILSTIFHADDQMSMVLSDTWMFVYNILYYIIPKTSHMGEMIFNFVSKKEISNLTPLYHSLSIAGILYFINLWIFKRKDF
ncbi:MAG: hypothetical protein JXR48_07315 [Candidatus Delongbacteria bacterium]|nr:hypothetical protein [Candidatus Delongbacteria bacterium]MBN2834760.1 hypothetical protein [Candidatus Delongbacteria bacterium]